MKIFNKEIIYVVNIDYCNPYYGSTLHKFYNKANYELEENKETKNLDYSVKSALNYKKDSPVSVYGSEIRGEKVYWYEDVDSSG